MNAIETITSALGWALVHAVWQLALIGLLVAIILGIFKKMPAYKKHFIVLSGLFIMLLSFAGTIGLYSSIIENPKVASEQFIPHQYSVNVLSQPAVQANGFTDQKTSFVERVQRFIATNTDLITGIWLLGFLFFAARFTGSALYIHRLRNKFAIDLEEKWQNIGNRIRQNLVIKRAIRILESAQVQVPITTGIFRPVIILPLGLATHIPFNQLEAVLVHEMAHIKRHDYLINLLRSLLEAVFFFHPVFWWLSAKLEKHREHACDDVTISHCGSAEPLQKALLDLSSYQPKPVNAAVALYKNSNQLLKRIKRMKTHQNNQKKKGNIAGLMLLPVVVLTLAVASAFAPRVENYPEMTSSNNHPPIEILTEAPPIPSNMNESAAVIQELEPLNKVNETSIPVPDSTRKTIGVKAKTEEGYILLEFDEDMNIQRITKDGEDLRGEEKEKYQRLADKTKQVFKQEEQMKKRQQEMEILQQQLEEVQKRMQDVKEEYNELWRSYQEKSMLDGDFDWPEVYADVLSDMPVVPPAFNVHPFYGDVPEHFDSLFPGPDYYYYKDYYDPDEFKDRFKESMEIYEDAVRNQKLEWEERMHDFQEQQELIQDQAFEQKILIEQQRALEKRIRSELLQDELIDAWDDLESFELSEDRLEVNGKRQSKKLHQKYIELFESVLDKPLEGKYEIH